jgi:hypothetical protein
MPRNDDLEALLQAQYDWEGAWPQEKAAYQKVFYALVRHHVRRYNAMAAARKVPEITEAQFREALSARYYEFKKRRDQEMRRRMSRLK